LFTPPSSRYIRELKKTAPFAETSPMLNDNSILPSWSKVSSGLLKLYEGEVVSKFVVVQHFVFGDLFRATWEPSTPPRSAAPAHTFVNPDDPFAEASGQARGGGTTRPDAMPPTRAPWAAGPGGAPPAPGGGGGPMPDTRAPWAK
jgi:hypothetical protein